MGVVGQIDSRKEILPSIAPPQATHALNLGAFTEYLVDSILLDTEEERGEGTKTCKTKIPAF